MKICIAGAGNMGKTFAESLANTHAAPKSDIYIVDIDTFKISYFKGKGFDNCFNQFGGFIKNCDVILLAVKPQERFNLYESLRPFVMPQHIVISIMAGVTIASIKEILGTDKVVRVMPNLPSMVGMGMMGFSADQSLTRMELFVVQNLLNAAGKSLYFDDESRLDAVTAVSGSGPAYVFYFVEAMVESAKKMGFTHSQAELLVEQTFIGALHLLGANEATPREWINKVASRGGTTEAALKEFDRLALSDNIHQGMQKAYERSIELGQ